MSFSLVCAEDVSNDTLISEYQNCGDVSVEDNVMNDVKLSSENEDISLDDYYSAESDSSVDASKNDDFFVDDSVGSFNQGYGELFDEDMGVVYFDENFVNYSLIDDNSKFISSRNRNSPISFSVGDIGRAAQSVLSYVNANQRLSGTVSVAGVRVNMNDFLYLLCKSLNTTENITYINYNHVSSISGTNKPGLFISKNVYKSIMLLLFNVMKLMGVIL